MGLGTLVIEVVLPTYNGAAYLREQVSSIYKQTLRPVRLIVRDDDSTDGTPQLLIELQQKYGPWLVLLPTECNLGCVANVNRLLQYTSAPYVALSDQDDIWLPYKLEHSFQALQQLETFYGCDTPLLIHSDLELINSDGSRIGSTYWSHQRLDPRRISVDQLSIANVVTGCTVLANRALVHLSLPIPPVVLMHDWWLALIAGSVGVIAYVEEPGILYRQHESNLIGACGISMNTVFRRWLRLGKKPLFERFYRVLAQAKVLQERLGLPMLQLVVLSQQPRLLRFWRLTTQSKLHNLFDQHRPLRSLCFRLIICLIPQQ